ncbi:MAG: PssD/Cps14F family polysaccharide biosynthesis glycosyltransferase [Cyanobacteria bacterium J06636_28]
MKLALVCTSGGHFSTMKSLRTFWQDHERIWITHPDADTKSLEKWGETVYWLPYQAPRKVTDLVRNLPATVRILRDESPDLVISTGASIAVNFGFVAKLLNMRFVFVESISRSQDLSLSGKLVYPICDEMYVQWADLCKRYPKARFQGHAIRSRI